MRDPPAPFSGSGKSYLGISFSSCRQLTPVAASASSALGSACHPAVASAARTEVAPNKAATALTMMAARQAWSEQRGEFIVCWEGNQRGVVSQPLVEPGEGFVLHVGL